MGPTQDTVHMNDTRLNAVHAEDPYNNFLPIYRTGTLTSCAYGPAFGLIAVSISYQVTPYYEVDAGEAHCWAAHVPKRSALSRALKEYRIMAETNIRS